MGKDVMIMHKDTPPKWLRLTHTELYRKWYGTSPGKALPFRELILSFEWVGWHMQQLLEYSILCQETQIIQAGNFSNLNSCHCIHNYSSDNVQLAGRSWTEMGVFHLALTFFIRPTSREIILPKEKASITHPCSLSWKKQSSVCPHQIRLRAPYFPQVHTAKAALKDLPRAPLPRSHRYTCSGLTKFVPTNKWNPEESEQNRTTTLSLKAENR